MMKKSFLITGCAGFIGFHLSNKLLNKGYNIYGVDNLNSYYSVKLKKKRLSILKKNKNFKFIKLDLIKCNYLKKKSFQFDYIFHLAAQAGVRYSITNPNEYTKSNLISFANILELARFKKVKHFYYASSSSVYGESLKKNKEHDNVDKQVSYYAATKRANEIMAESYSNLYNLKMTGIRFFTVYGPWGRPDMALLKFIKNIHHNKSIKIFNNGNHKRDFTYIEDVTDYLFKLIQKKKNYSHEIFNICRDKSEKLIKFLNKIEFYLNKKSKKIFLNKQKGDVRETSGSNKKISKYLKYYAKTSIDEGIDKTIRWYKDYEKIF